jgi:predicted  nucleic acid-binding Zn-ribbon protein
MTAASSTRHNWSPEDRETYEALQQGLAEENAKLASLNVEIKALNAERDRQQQRIAEKARDLRHAETAFDYKVIKAKLERGEV